MSDIYKDASLLSIAELEGTFATSIHNGLSNAAVQKKLEVDGLNLIKSQKVSSVSIFLRQFRSPFIYLLFGAAIISYFLGEARDSLFILLFITINSSLGFYQEYKSEKTAALLESFVESEITVLREGKWTILPASNLCIGDILELKPGDIVQGDARVISSNNFSVDESVLTGESESQQKYQDPLKTKPTDLYQAKNIVFSGSTVVIGSATVLVIGTGSKKLISTITKLVTESDRVSTFEKGISSFSKYILRTILVTLTLMVAANLIVKGSTINIPELLLFAIALAVSVIPEALPIVTTFSLSQGANRLAKKKVIVKRLSAIEDMGSISVLCTDKTGTITQNKMTLSKTLKYKNEDVRFWASLGSNFLGTKVNNRELDSFDQAIYEKLTESELTHLKEASRIDFLPFDPERKRTTVFVELKNRRYVITRGAPENVLPLCTDLREEIGIEDWIKKEGYLGNRVMAVSYCELPKHAQKKDFSKYEKSMHLSGILSFEDPLKPSTIEAVNKARSLGVQLKILTGDRAEVAASVGIKIGLINSHFEVLTGEQFSRLNTEQKHEAVLKYHIFARVTPNLKYEIIKLLEEQHDVGFLGEGINDAPALKIANVGIVVNSGSDISKEASDIILLNKSLLTIIEGIEEGRVVFANTVKYIKATLASNFGNFYAVAISSLFIPYLPMLPIQILLVNLLSDFPMISIATDNVDSEELSSPRSYNIHEVAGLATVLGLVSTTFDFLTFALFFRFLPGVLQTNWFMESILTELVLIYSIRTRRSFLKAKMASKSIFILTGVAAAITILLPLFSGYIKGFGFVVPHISHLAIIFTIVVAYFLCTEVAKIALYKLSFRRLS